MTQHERIIVLLADNSTASLEEWQHCYGLEVGSLQIGKYFCASEPKFQEDLKNYGVLIVSELLIRVMDAARNTWGKPLTVNSFNRNEAKQQQLKQSGARAATYSPHVVFLAMDVDTTTAAETRDLAKVILQEARKLKIVVRVGYADYIAQGNTFVHVDVCPEYYAPGKPRYIEQHPAAWEKAYSVW